MTQTIPSFAHRIIAAAGIAAAVIGPTSLAQPFRGEGPALKRIDRLHHTLRDGQPPRFAVVREKGALFRGKVLDQPVIAAIVVFDEQTPAAERLRTLDAAGVDIINELFAMPAAVIEGPRDQVLSLVDEQGVVWIEPPLPRLEPVNAEARVTNHVNEVQASPYNLSGDGVSVMVWDAGSVDTSHPDFSGRATRRDPQANDFHATHVAGTIAGDGTNSGGLSSPSSERGMAPGAGIESFAIGGPFNSSILFYQNPFDFESDYQRAYDQYGVDLSNNSVGSNIVLNGYPCSIAGDYGVSASLIDSYIYNGGNGSVNNPVRVVWSAGNERQGGSPCGTYGTVPPPATNKNAMVIGAINSDTLEPASFSSFGPTDDGRIKPDLVASGCQAFGDGGIRSTDVGGGYLTICGTSMSGPVVAGISALVLEDFRAQFPERPDPANATIKALLIHSAEDLGRPGPDYQNGYGMARALEAIDLLREGNHFEGVVSPEISVMQTITVDPDEEELRLTLVWDDLPAAPGVSNTLVNDLDLVVTSPSGQRFYPWTLDPELVTADAVRTSADHTNNVEQVLVDNPEAGTWVVSVESFSVQDGVQQFSLVSSEPVTIANLELLTLAPLNREPGIQDPVSVRVDGVQNPVVNLLFVPDSGETAQMIEFVPGAGDTFEAALPASLCEQLPAYAIEVREGGQLVLRAPAAGMFESVVGLPITPFADSFEAAGTGWSVGSPTDDATTGIWERAQPQATFASGIAAQPGSGSTLDSQFVYVTGGAAGSSAGSFDIDNGATTLNSPLMDLADFADASISFDLWYSNSAGAAPGEDVFVVDISDDGGSTWTNALTVGPSGAGTDGGWISYQFNVADFVTPSDAVRLRFIASDEGSGSLVEAALDNVSVDTLLCENPVEPTPCPGDANDDGSVTIADVLFIIARFGENGSGVPGDTNEDETVTIADVLFTIARFGDSCEP